MFRLFVFACLSFLHTWPTADHSPHTFLFLCPKTPSHTHSLNFLYSSTYSELKNTTFEFAHKPYGWIMQLGYYVEEGIHDDLGYYTLQINGVDYSIMAEAPPRERAALARSSISMKMDGPKK